MYESDDDVRWLQALLDRSHARMGPHMRSILTPDRALDARQVVRYLEGVKHVALATVTASGEPRVAPMDALFVRGRFHLGTAGAAARIRHLRRRPTASLTHFVGDALSVTVHGTAVLLGRDHPEAPGLERIYVDVYGSTPFVWAEDAVLVRLEPAAMYAHAQDPSRYPADPSPPPAPPPARTLRAVPARRGRST
jgi:uncharacterized pyridoxamine 5'-phosphate oxidase family protein